MNDSNSMILLLALFAPAAAAILSFLIPSAQAGAFRRLAAVSALVSLGAVLWLSIGPGAGSPCSLRVPWIPEIGASFSISLDGASRLLLVLGSLVGVAGVAVGRDVRAREKEFYLLYQFLVSGGLLAIVAQDLLLLYVSYEVDVLCSFLLIACWGDWKNPSETRTTSYAATLLTLFLAGGAVCLLAGIWMLHHGGGGTFELAALRAHLAAAPLPAGLQTALFGLLFAGFGTLLAIWPCHPWAPLGYAAAPTSVSMLGAGFLKSLGAYGLIRVAVPLLPDGAQACAGLMAGLAVANILFGAWIALRQTDWKFLLGYSSVSHMGYVLLGIASLNSIGGTGAILLLFAHGLGTAAAFALVGHIENEVGARRLDAASGLARTMPFVGVVFVMTAMSLCGLPGFASFWGEVLVFIGAWEQGTRPFRIAAIAAVWGLVVTATYMLMAIRTSLYGPPRAEASRWRDAGPLFRIACLALLLVAMAVGVQPRLATDPVQVSVRGNGFHDAGGARP